MRNYHFSYKIRSDIISIIWFSKSFKSAKWWEACLLPLQIFPKFNNFVRNFSWKIFQFFIYGCYFGAVSAIFIFMLIKKIIGKIFVTKFTPTDQCPEKDTLTWPAIPLRFSCFFNVLYYFLSYFSVKKSAADLSYFKLLNFEI